MTINHFKCRCREWSRGNTIAMRLKGMCRSGFFTLSRCAVEGFRKHVPFMNFLCTVLVFFYVVLGLTERSEVSVSSQAFGITLPLSWSGPNAFLTDWYNFSQECSLFLGPKLYRYSFLYFKILTLKKIWPYRLFQCNPVFQKPVCGFAVSQI